MVWLIIASVAGVLLMLMLYACIVAGARADREIERLLRKGAEQGGGESPREQTTFSS